MDVPYRPMNMTPLETLNRIGEWKKRLEGN
jgi:hypothetical protein